MRRPDLVRLMAATVIGLALVVLLVGTESRALEKITAGFFGGGLLALSIIYSTVPTGNRRPWRRIIFPFGTVVIYVVVMKLPTALIFETDTAPHLGQYIFCGVSTAVFVMWHQYCFRLRFGWIRPLLGFGTGAVATLLLVSYLPWRHSLWDNLLLGAHILLLYVGITYVLSWRRDWDGSPNITVRSPIRFKSSSQNNAGSDKMRVTRFLCRSCDQPLEATADMIGKSITCPKCSNSLVIPAPNVDDPESWLRLPDISPVTYEKVKFYFILSIGVLISLLVILYSEPQEISLWIFTTESWPYQYFVAFAFIIAAMYLFALVYWYGSDKFEASTSVLAFLVCGGISIMTSLLLYKIFNAVSIESVHTVWEGWLIFKRPVKVIHYASPVYEFLHRYSVHAAFIEEPAKFGALLLVPQVRGAIVDRRSGLYYATLCAFGFALLENIFYFNASQAVLFIRANPAHAVFTSIWGAAYGSWVAKEITPRLLCRCFVYGIGLHALWNYTASVEITLFLITFTATIWWGLKFIKKGLKGTAPQDPIATSRQSPSTLEDSTA